MAPMPLATIHVNQKLVKIDAEKPTVQEVVIASGRDPSTVDAKRLRNPGDEQGEAIEMAAVLDRTASPEPIWLHCIPKDRNVGNGISPRLQEDVILLAQAGYHATLTPNGTAVYATFSDYRLPKGKFTHETTNVLVIIPLPYPDAKIDMFYTDTGVLLHGGTVPQNAEVIEQHLGRNWRRFSWHTQKWDPRVDDLAGHVAMINARLYEVS